MRIMVGVISGIVASLAIVLAVRLLALALHALPAGMNFSQPQAMAAWLAGAPAFALALFAAAWFFGALAGGWIALRISGWAVAAWIVAGIDLLLSSATLLQHSYPLWMKILLVAGPLLGGWLAIRLLPAPSADESING